MTWPANLHAHTQVATEQLRQKLTARLRRSQAIRCQRGRINKTRDFSPARTQTMCSSSPGLLQNQTVDEAQIATSISLFAGAAQPPRPQRGRHILAQNQHSGQSANRTVPPCMGVPTPPRHQGCPDSVLNAGTPWKCPTRVKPPKDQNAVEANSH